MTTARQTTDDPDACHVCGRHAIGIGVGKHPDNRWLCAECLPILEYVRSVRRLDAYEIKAIEMAGEKAGELLDGFGKTDLAEMDEGEWRQFCKTMCLGFGDSMRKLIRENEAPF
ncbi:DUF6511 domain-containing protein [Mesorhizobium sp.]|uniref:DUF6511 domain-containing protein n=1 Tax=Mesorhizobium sp. TaxID=1871066 RepID=UPI00121AE57B|nr:DUF6511 domain-containing protein [Mesorhizobium sp.]TIN83118.1 MAG: hypothetical protein E5X97_27700 [Mesorhizobium sp.]